MRIIFSDLECVSPLNLERESPTKCLLIAVLGHTTRLIRDNPLETS